VSIVSHDFQKSLQNKQNLASFGNRPALQSGQTPSSPSSLRRSFPPSLILSRPHSSDFISPISFVTLALASPNSIMHFSL
jgi:hypothetical protein